MLTDTPAAIFVDKHFLIDKHTHDLFNKEGIPFGPGENSVAQHAREIFCLKQGIHQFVTFLTRE